MLEHKLIMFGRLYFSYLNDNHDMYLEYIT
jgi:hypothetical protein